MTDAPSASSEPPRRRRGREHAPAPEQESWLATPADGAGAGRAESGAGSASPVLGAPLGRRAARRRALQDETAPPAPAGPPTESGGLPLRPWWTGAPSGTGGSEWSDQSAPGAEPPAAPAASVVPEAFRRSGRRRATEPAAPPTAVEAAPALDVTEAAERAPQVNPWPGQVRPALPTPVAAASESGRRRLGQRTSDVAVPRPPTDGGAPGGVVQPAPTAAQAGATWVELPREVVLPVDAPSVHAAGPATGSPVLTGPVLPPAELPGPVLPGVEPFVEHRADEAAESRPVPPPPAAAPLARRRRLGSTPVRFPTLDASGAPVDGTPGVEPLSAQPPFVIPGRSSGAGPGTGSGGLPAVSGPISGRLRLGAGTGEAIAPPAAAEQDLSAVTRVSRRALASAASVPERPSPEEAESSLDVAAGIGRATRSVRRRGGRVPPVAEPAHGAAGTAAAASGSAVSSARAGAEAAVDAGTSVAAAADGGTSGAGATSAATSDVTAHAAARSATGDRRAARALRAVSAPAPEAPEEETRLVPAVAAAGAPQARPRRAERSEHVPSEGAGDQTQRRRLTAVPNPQPAAPVRTGRAGRNLPAAIGVGVLLGGAVLASLLIRKEAFLVVIAAAVVTALWELSTALRTKGIGVPLVPLVVGALGMLVSAFVAGEDGLLVSFTLTAFGVLLWRIIDGEEGATRDVAAAVFVAAYVPFLAGFAMLMLAMPDGALRVIVFIAVTVANDVGGYATGVLTGRHPMAPSISPKKSWEGLGGSVLLCMLVGAGTVHWMLHGSFLAGLAVGAAAAATATLGDLSESLMKRDLKIKDMGNLLPGHGGMMDRLDSLLPTAPAVCLLLLLLVPAA